MAGDHDSLPERGPTFAATGNWLRDMLLRRVSMRFYRLTSRVLTLGLFILTATSVGFAQQTRQPVDQDQPGVQTRDIGNRPWSRPIGSGQKAKVKGGIISRDVDTFSIRDEQDREVVVVLTGQTSIKSKGGWFSRGKSYIDRSLTPGLRVEVEGIGNEQGQLIANKVRFDNDDMKVAQSIDWRVAPVEEANRRLSGQVDELGEVSRAARAEAGLANERITSLDDYTVETSVNVYFRTGSAVIAPEDRSALDQLAQRAMTAKGYVIEIAGFADSTGNTESNRVLSQKRAEAVVRYLQENHEIPLRRMTTAFGYGEMKPVADNNTLDGRRQNRRVEVKILVSKGINQPSTVSRQ